MKDKDSVFSNSEYIVLNSLGDGGEATVYKVRHKELDYVRAVRILNKPILEGKKSIDYQKFVEECKLLLRLGNGCNPNIVRVYKPELVSGHDILEMDYIDGCNITQYLEENKNFVEIDEVIKLLYDIGGALAYCHEDIFKYCINRDVDDVLDDPDDGEKMLIDDAKRQELINKYRIIHNDIHSGNIMRREDGNYVLLDFGLSLDGNCKQRSSKKQGGVPEFKAPEKWDNDILLTAPTDIYSFGVLLYEFLCGRVPFKLNGNPNSLNVMLMYELGKAHREEKPKSFFEYRKQAYENRYENKEYVKDYPDWLEQLVMKCLEKKPENRFKNGKELMAFVKENDKKTKGVVTEDKNGEELLKQKQTIEKLNEELRKMESQCENLHDEKVKLIHEVDELETHNDVLKKENDGLKNRNKKLLQANNNLRVELEQLRTDEIDDVIYI